MAYERLNLQNNVDKWTAEHVSHVEDGIVANEKALENKQPKGNYLTEHQKLKTINGQSIVGDGDIWIGGSGNNQDMSAYLTKEVASQTYQPKGNYLTEHQKIKTINGVSIVGAGNVTFAEVYIGDTAPTGGQLLWIDTSGDGGGNTGGNTGGDNTGGNTGGGDDNTGGGDDNTGDNTDDGNTGGDDTGGGGDNTSGGNGGTGRLPAEYQEVEYVSTVKALYNAINSGVPSDTVSKIEMGLKSDFSAHLSIATTAATYDTGATTDFGGTVNMDTQPCINNTGPNTKLTGKGFTFFKATANPSEYQTGGEVYVDFVFEMDCSASRYYCFGDCNTAGWNTAPKVFYYIKMYDSNDVLIADLVPCYRKSDNKPGMYDVVRNTFHVPANGNFTKGADV